MRQQAEMRLGEAAGSSNEAETTDGIALFVRVCSASPPHPFGSPSRAGAWGFDVAERRKWCADVIQRVSQ